MGMCFFQLHYGKKIIIFDEMMMTSFFFYQTNMLTWIFVNVSSLKQQYTGWHSDTFSWLWANQSLLALLNAVYRVEKKNSNLKVFGLTQLGIKPMIYHTEGKNTGQTNDLPYWRQECRSNPLSTILKARIQVKPTIYDTEGKNADYYTTEAVHYWQDISINKFHWCLS